MPIREALIGDGRALALLPVDPLTAGEVVVRVGPSPQVTDLTGQPLALTAGEELARFTVTDTPTPGPTLVGTFPSSEAGQGVSGVGDTSEIVVAFDRPVLGVSDATFDVRVNGAAPAQDPPAQAVTIDGTPDTRVFRYRSTDGAGVSVPFPSGATLSLSLGSGITDAMGAPLAPVATIDYTVTPFSTPTGARLRSDPPDAIGLRNLTEGDPQEITLEVDLGTNLAMGDIVDLFVFGQNNTDVEEEQFTIARTSAVPVDPAMSMLTFDFEAIDPVLRSAPIVSRFMDGPVSYAFRFRRGTMLSPLMVLDIDPVNPGIQDPVQDTIRPQIEGMLDVVRSDQGNLVITGKATEPLRRAEVSSVEVGDNGTGTDATVIGSGPDGSFVARPIDTGGILIDPTDGDSTVSFSFAAFDQALNRLSTGAVSGVFTQVGAVAGPFTPGELVDVEVFDAITLAPLPGALIHVHGDDGDDVGYPFLATSTTGADGRQTVATPGAPSVGALITIDLPGYDLFTFDGIPSRNVSIPLMPSGAGATAFAEGEVASQDSVVAATLRDADKGVGDTRTPQGAEAFFAPGTCNPFLVGTLSCLYGPEPVRPDRLGAQTLVSGDFSQLRNVFNPVLAIEAFELVLPVPAVPTTLTHDGLLNLPFLLTDARAGPTELPVELPMVSVDASGGVSGLGTTLDPDPLTGGNLRVTVESLAPGLGDPIPVGFGQAFADAPDQWTVRSVRPGAVGPGGFFEDSLDTDPFLAIELRDDTGNRSVRRTRVSNLAASAVPPDVTQLVSPAPSSVTVGPSYNLVVENTIPGGQGLYEVRLVDSTGRGWNVWHLDEPGASGTVVLHLPDLAPGMGMPLASGTIRCVVRSYARSGFMPGFFLWSELRRETEVFSESAEVTFDQP